MRRPCWVVKLGGSLIPNHVEGLIAVLTAGAPDRGGIAIVPGGGRVVATFREYRDVWPGLNARALYECAILAMLQHALLIRDRTGFAIAREPVIAARAMGVGHRCLFVPHLEGLDDEVFHDWNIDRSSSDTIAAYCATVARAVLVKLTDVDGVFDRDPRLAGASLLLDASPEQITDRTCIDQSAPRLMARHGIDTWILNGRHPERLAALLAGHDVVGTHVRAALK